MNNVEIAKALERPPDCESSLDDRLSCLLLNPLLSFLAYLSMRCKLFIYHLEGECI